jgi:hypothetical protein
MVEIHVKTSAGAGRDGLEPAHGGGAQTAAVEPPAQEGHGHRVDEAQLRGLTHRIFSRIALIDWVPKWPMRCRVA